MIWNAFDRIIWVVGITLLLISAFQYLRIALNKENKDEKLILLDFTILFLGWGIFRIAIYLSELAISGNYVNFIFYADYDNVYPIYEYLYSFFLIGNVFCTTIFVLIFEIYFKRTKYILTLVNCILIIIVLLAASISTELLFQWYSFQNLFFGACVVGIFLIYTIRSSIEFKSISSIILFGIILILIGWNTADESIKRVTDVPLTLTAILFLIGTIIVLIPTIIDTKFLSQSLTYWTILGIVGPIILFSIAIYYIFIDAGLSNIVKIFIYGILAIPMVLIVIFDIKSENKIETDDENLIQDRPNILASFTKRQNLTNEEIIISKEKRICLVCRNEIFRLNYNCPNCKSFYCQKCAKTLEELENSCWVCDTPFDETKPIKPQIKEVEEKIKIIEEEPHKTTENRNNLKLN